MPYVYKMRFLDTRCCIRRDGDILKIGVSSVLVHQDGEITVKAKEFRRSEGMWELLTRRRVNKEHVKSNDQRKYTKILLLTNAHLEVYQPGGVINVSRRKMFREIFASVFASPKGRVFESGLRRAWKKY